MDNFQNQNENPQENANSEQTAPAQASMPTFEQTAEAAAVQTPETEATSFSYTASPSPAPEAPKKKKKSGRTALFVCLGALLFLFGIGAGYGANYLATNFDWSTVFPWGSTITDEPQDNDSKNEESRPANKEENKDLSGGTFAPIYGTDNKTFSPAQIYDASVHGVVGISTEITTQNVFGQQSAYATSGTGFIFSKDGYILTNCHVVEGASSITVTLYGGAEYTATLVGADSQNDVAVLKIDANSELTALTMGKSEDMVVGEEILVIGNPLGELTYTLTRGIVSNLSRDILVEDNATTIRMFQTDAAINNGNSGGPAINCHGNVIGIVSAKYASSSIEGLGFCIPIDDAMRIAKDLIEIGYVQGRPWLGVEGQAVSGYAGQTYIAGVRIVALQEGGAAEKAGVRRGDIITAVADVEVTTVNELKSALNAYLAGDQVELTIYRNRESILITVVLDEAKS
ncbi:MAG: trypsin-like peptidase domain-containing protein [Clostridia bacterium]|nr:trypsin-like peptidase domain-containing protein [Clostridia bacterium]